MINKKILYTTTILSLMVPALTSFAGEKAHFYNDPTTNDKHFKYTHLYNDINEKKLDTKYTSDIHKKLKAKGESMGPILLDKIAITGNKSIDVDTLMAGVSSYIGKNLNKEHIKEITKNIEDTYRKHGYLLPLAYVKDADNGRLDIDVIEGKIRDVEVLVAEDQKSALNNTLLQQYLDKILEEDPAKTRHIQRYLLLINKIPGYEASYELKPITSQNKSNELADIIIEIKKSKANLRLDTNNHGSGELGRQQFSVSGNIFNPTKYNDTIMFNFGTSQKPKALKIATIGYQKRVNAAGSSFSLLYSHLEDNPASKVSGSKDNKSDLVKGMFGHYFMLSNANSIKGEIGAEYRDVSSYLVANKTATYHYTTGFIGAKVMAFDPLGAENWLNPYFHTTISHAKLHRIDPVNATTFDKNFNYIDVDWFRDQPLPGAFSLFTHVIWQHTNKVLPLEAQFFTGSHNIGKGYKSGLVNANKGVGVDIELRFTKDVDVKFLDTLRFCFL